MTITPEVRTLVGSEVAVETTSGVVLGLLLSCTAHSLWLVSDEVDLMVPMATIHAVHAPTPVG
ncbi:MAG TPA: hypothetical protein VGJ03_16085 [Acidimicrobiales bacterium]|jgi:hypothetical protein